MTIPLWRWLEEQGAHHDFVKWARPFEDAWERAWSECPRGDWLLGLAARRGVDRGELVLAARACAELAMDYVPDDEPRPRAALDAAARWSEGQDDVQARARAAAEVERCIDEAPDPAVAAAAGAAYAALRAIDAPDEAASVAMAVAQAAVFDAGDCAMMSALGFAHHTCAERVRAHVSFAAIALA